jgi:uncharacterized membrane protein SirB2
MDDRGERMMTFYPSIKHLHMAVALTSGGLFALRGAGLLLDQRWPRHALLRYLSYSVDTVLLTAALFLLTLLPAALFANGWLLVKVGFVVAYIALGMLAFQTRRGLRARATLWLLALLCFVQIYGIARTHDPLGWLLWL